MRQSKEQSKGSVIMSGSSRPRTDWILGGLLLTLFLLSLTGCSSKSVRCERAQIPAEWSETQLPDAKAYSEKVSNFFEKVRIYQSETPQFTTPSPQ